MSRKSQKQKVNRETTLLKSYKDVMVQEINWCRAHPDGSGKGRDYETGFIAGLFQAVNLLKATDEMLKGMSHAEPEIVTEG